MLMLLEIINEKILQNPAVDFIFGTVKRHYTKGAF